MTLKDLPAPLGTHEALPPCPGAPGAGQEHKTHAGQLLPCQAAALPAFEYKLSDFRNNV